MEVVSGAGDGVFWVGLIAVLLDQGVGAGGFAAAVVARLAPRAFLSASTTAWAERHRLRTVLVSLDGGRAVCMGVLGSLAAAGAPAWTMLLPVTATYCLAAPYRPLVTGALPAVASERELSSLNARVSTVRQLMTFLGPLCGTFVVGAGSAAACFATNGVTFVVSAVLVGRVREFEDASKVAPRAGGPSGSWRPALDEPGVRVIAVLVGAMYLVRGAELVLFALLAGRLDMGDGGIGVLTGAVGLGALAVMPASSRLADRVAPDRALLVASLATVVPMLVMAMSDSLAVVCAALLVLGASVVVFEVVSVVTLQRLVPRAALARSFGVIAAASNAGKLVGALVAPVLVLAFSLGAAFVAVAWALAAVGIGCASGLSNVSDRASARRRVLRPTVDVLSGLRLFDGASAASLERLAPHVSERDVVAGEVLIRQGDPADALYIVRSGVFDADVSGTKVNTISPGGWFGEIGLLQEVPRTATVVAATDGVVWRVPGPAFLDALSDVASMPAALVTEMAERLRRTEVVEGRLDR